MKINRYTEIDLDTLTSSRMLIQANSGGGKSWFLRRILEQTFGKIQHIIIDVEGEFYTLREKFDYIHVGQDGDLIPDFKTAGKLAHKVMELHANIILDLYDMKLQARREYVRLFLNSLLNLPHKLRHPCLVIVDEAHTLCPQKDSQSSSTGAVNDLMSMGRKRGLCGVLATQRLSKLNKDAAAECINICIGRTTMDVDVKRAGDVLGFHKSDYPTLRGLEPGEFFITGPALSQTVKKVKVGNVKTQHPKIGFTKKVKIMRTKKIKAILGKLEGLPQEVNKQKNTLKDLRQQVNTLKKELIQVKKAKPEFPEKRIQMMVDTESQKRVNEFVKKLSIGMNKTLKDIAAEPLMDERTKPLTEVFKNVTRTVPIHQRPGKLEKIPVNLNNTDYTQNKVTGGAIRILQALESYPEDSLTRVQVGALAVLKHSSGTFSNYISQLKQSGYIRVSTKGVSITEEGVSYLLDNDLISPIVDIKAMWRSKLKGGSIRMFDILVENYPTGLSKADLAEQAGLEVRSGTYSNYLSKLRTNELMRIEDGICYATDILFMEG